jgi:hypothetical protein
MRTLLFATTLSSLVMASAIAAADLANPDVCNAAGEACTTAGPNYDRPGTCTPTKCNRATPNGPVEYDCNKCVEASGTGGSSSATGGSSSATGGTSSGTGGSNTAGASSEPKDADSDGGGCSMGGRGSTPFTWAPLVLAGLGLLARARVRRR